ncbi:hypothetical protein OAS39_10500 [Pirellulales bacterium]|nr:hypothetical protein [Pirellulales bacterium]
MHNLIKKPPFRLLGSAAVAVATICAASPALSETISAVVDLTPATAAENTFEFTISALSQSDTQTVTYQGVIRPTLEVDFSNINSPVITSMNFAGQASDIVHSDATASLGGLGTVALSNILSCIVTFPGSVPAAVTGASSPFAFSSADHEIIFGSGIVELNPAIGSTTIVDLATEPFRRSLGGTNDSTVALTLNNIAAGVATYDLEIIIPLVMVNVETDDPGINALVDILVDGNLVAKTQITRQIPEPTGLILIACACGVPWAWTRRRTR